MVHPAADLIKAKAHHKHIGWGVLPQDVTKSRAERGCTNSGQRLVMSQENLLAQDTLNFLLLEARKTSGGLPLSTQFSSTLLYTAATHSKHGETCMGMHTSGTWQESGQTPYSAWGQAGRA